MAEGKRWYSVTQKNKVNPTDKMLIYDGSASYVVPLSLVKGADNLTNEYVELEGEDAEVFKTAKCPYCSQSLSKIAMKSDFIEIQCDDIKCGCKFKVNVNTGKIYHV